MTPINRTVAAMVSCASPPSLNTLRCSSLPAVQPVIVREVIELVCTLFATPAAAVTAVDAVLKAAGSSVSVAFTAVQIVATVHSTLPLVDDDVHDRSASIVPEKSH